MKKLVLSLLLVTAQLVAINAHIDLEERSQPFVLETRRLQIPGFSDAFNPSIVRWNGGILLSFRARDPLTKSTNLVGFVWLNEELEPITDPALLQIKSDSLGRESVQDPRLIVVEDKLFMVYSNLTEISPGDSQRRVFLAEVQYNEGSFSAMEPQLFRHFDADRGKKYEKNWVPFDYAGKLFLSYKIDPHRVFLTLPEEESCLTLSETAGKVKWDYGQLFGGTPALFVRGQYLSFFHSSKAIYSLQSQGKRMTHYFIGAYTFEAAPPFALTGLSPEPIVGEGFYNGPAYKTWKPLRVVYPCGILEMDDVLWISYGRQDHEAWLAKVDIDGLLASLTPIATDEGSGMHKK